MNSTYGALLSPHFRYGRKELGASVTACGRQITTHMLETINSLLSDTQQKLVKTTEVDEDGKISNTYEIGGDVVVYSDTDSITGDSLIYVNGAKMPIAQLYDTLINFEYKNDKTKSFVKPAKHIFTLCSDGKNILEKPIKYVMKHRVEKEMFAVGCDERCVSVTADHSIMVIRNKSLLACKPMDIKKNDALVIICESTNKAKSTKDFQIKSLGIQQVDVYDIEVEKMHNFFANDILVHNSCYFKTHASNKQEAIAIADEVASQVNATFQGFMQTVFNCQPGYDNLIKAGREVVAERGLFQAKKKYVLKVVDLEGKSVDKLKSQGSEIKKSDTPKVIQAFLKDLMSMILSGKSYSDIESFVNSSRKNLLGKDGDVFSMGVAKQANNVDAKYAEWQRVEKPGKGKVNLPGHIRAAINYNEEVQLHEEGAKLIKAGDKVKVFYLKPNSRGYKSIAFPAELESFPAWFESEFNVDKKLTEEKMFDLKLDGVFSACGWEVPTPQLTLTKKIFTF